MERLSLTIKNLKGCKKMVNNKSLDGNQVLTTLKYQIEKYEAYLQLIGNEGNSKNLEDAFNKLNLDKFFDKGGNSLLLEDENVLLENSMYNGEQSTTFECESWRNMSKYIASDSSTDIMNSSDETVTFDTTASMQLRKDEIQTNEKVPKVLNNTAKGSFVIPPCDISLIQKNERSTSSDEEEEEVVVDQSKRKYKCTAQNDRDKIDDAKNQLIMRDEP